MDIKRRYDSPTLLIEDSPISRGLIHSLREKSINVTPYRPNTDKRSRVIAQTDLFAGGSVRFPRSAAWLEDFIAELLAFPGRHDDQVDALTQGLALGVVFAILTEALGSEVIERANCQSGSLPRRLIPR